MVKKPGSQGPEGQKPEGRREREAAPQTGTGHGKRRSDDSAGRAAAPMGEATGGIIGDWIDKGSASASRPINNYTPVPGKWNRRTALAVLSRATSARVSPRNSATLAATAAT